MKDKKIVFLEAQVEEKASLNQQLQEALQVLKKCEFIRHKQEAGKHLQHSLKHPVGSWFLVTKRRAGADPYKKATIEMFQVKDLAIELE